MNYYYYYYKYTRCLCAVEQVPSIADSVCVGQRRRGDGEERVVLFLKMKEGEEFSPQVEAQLVALIRRELSVRHVPALMLPIDDIPVRGG